MRRLNDRIRIFTSCSIWSIGHFPTTTRKVWRVTFFFFPTLFDMSYIVFWDRTKQRPVPRNVLIATARRDRAPRGRGQWVWPLARRGADLWHHVGAIWHTDGCGWEKKNVLFDSGIGGDWLPARIMIAMGWDDLRLREARQRASDDDRTILVINLKHHVAGTNRHVNTDLTWYNTVITTTSLSFVGCKCFIHWVLRKNSNKWNCSDLFSNASAFVSQRPSKQIKRPTSNNLQWQWVSSFIIFSYLINCIWWIGLFWSGFLNFRRMRQLFQKYRADIKKKKGSTAHRL